MFREDEEDFDIGETSLFALLYTQQLACPRQHLCFQYVRISILRSTLYHVEEEKRKKEKENSLNCGRKKNIIDHILLTVDCSETNYFNIEEG